MGKKDSKKGAKDPRPAVTPITEREREFFRRAIKQQFRCNGDDAEWENELVLKLLDVILPHPPPDLAFGWNVKLNGATHGL